MALVIENGTCVAGANSYVDIPTADTYHSDRGNAAWGAASDQQKTAALLAATAYIDGRYRMRWKGARVQPVFQPLEWPRLAVNMQSAVMGTAFTGHNYYSNYLSNKVPPEVVYATCEAALRALTAPLAADIQPQDRLVREKLGPIESEWKPNDFTVTYQVIDQLLARFLKGQGDAMRG